MTQNSLVTIVTPSFNSSRYLSETIESVLNQTYGNWEMIIVDDYSSDSSLEIASRFNAQDSRIRILTSNSHNGPAVARNRAIVEARGLFIAFLDSDDVWLPEKLERQIAFMREKNAVLSYTAYQKIDENGVRRGIVDVPLKVDYKKMLNSNYIACSTAIYDAEKLGKVFMPDILKRQDHGLWLSILKRGYSAYGINEPLGYYRVRKSSVSSNKLVAAKYQWKLYREVEKMTILASLYHFMQYAYIGFRKNSV